MNLDELRNHIDSIDLQIIKLLGARLNLSSQIGVVKNSQGLDIEDRGRENQIITKIKQLAEKEGLNATDAANIYDIIFKASKSAQGLAVAFQGEFGAFSEIAATKIFGTTTRIVPLESLEDVFRTVQRGDAPYGVIPVENSLEGSIDTAYNLLLDSTLTVSGELELKISHCLIANRGASLSSINKIYSHPQALGQCQAFIKHLGCQLIPTYDTAGSVKLIKNEKITDGAAIASSRAAEIYDMEILASDIQDNLENYTRFFVISKKASDPNPLDKTSVIFTVKHEPGALSGILNAFAVENINLTKLESRPTRRKPWEYKFYMDFEGNYRDPGPARALKSANQYAIFIKILGSYPKVKERS
ncbi:MAG: prephenate dehydratase [Dehalococcoidales bacterium]